MSEEQNTRAGRRQARQTKKKDKKPRKGLFKKIVIAIMTLGILAILGGGITAFVMIQGAPPLDEERLQLSQALIIHDKNDEFVSQLDSSERRINISIQDAPQVLEDAFIAVEDIRFYDHFGIDVRRMFGALAANVTDGFGAEGASTITQQLVKNLFLNEQKQLTRKVQEQYLAVKLEQKYSKDQILEMYMNQIYLGSGGWGVEAASQSYFNKSIQDLTLADAALLAGIPRRPSFYDPTQNPEAAESRRNLVISLMEQHGKVTSEEAAQAKAIPIEDQLNPSGKREAYPYEAFYNQIVSEIEAMDGISIHDLYHSGLRVYTTLDVEAQEHVERVLQTNDFIANYPDNEFFQAGITLLDTKTGEIRAIGSGLEDTGIQRGLNYATEIERQPGSTIKPILDYGPAIEYLQWSTAKVLVDEAHTYSNGTEFGNFGGTYEGAMSMRRALARSRNVPAVKALQEVGVDRAANFAQGLGIPIDQDPMPESYGLGGFNTGFSTMDLAGAYAAFGNNGTYNKPHTVRKIVFPDGREINTSPEPTAAMSDYTAYMVTDMLKTAVTDGTGTTANIPGLPMAGKTGTTNFAQDTRTKHNIPRDGVPDVWFSGYTTNYTAAVWAGFTKYDEGNYLQSQEDRRLAQRIFKAVMEEVSSNVETPDFTQPNSVVRIGVERSTGLLPSEFTPRSEIVEELFVRGNEPTRVSEEFIRLQAPSNMTAGYDEGSNQVIVSWDYPSNQRDAVTFDLQLSVNGSSPQTVAQGSDMQFILSDVEPGATYRFTVTAVSNDNSSLRSDPASAEVTINGAEEEEEEELEEEPIEEEETEEPQNPDGENEEDNNQEDEGNNNGNNNGNNGNNGNGNGNGNGNNNDGSGNEETPPAPEEPGDDEEVETNSSSTREEEDE
ncbi:penicillin-binding proteins 1A/1B [Alkalihalophilus pseudofirmus OF4]|uniref:Penicillin-binding proteins 1A/1B n=1 Tax=Alkalihalophilus pseudofirmus (strain ATCC BAA-2126 / JCM 17055 / OF4) TaxID=398511 RepID=D3G0M4_ALKPO|nr:PBP1A family penicillin-binding protein [Alkalihalophilus pseudofirmus]ADC51186.1 penicillin-binding proteins 1A/1B [Alkalihalophilus pseudofirmus OF4]